MKKNFEIGDRVKVTNLLDKSMEEFVMIGEVGTVVKVSYLGDKLHGLLVKLDDFTQEGNYNLEEYFKEVLGEEFTHEEVYFNLNAIGFAPHELEVI